MFSYLYWIFLFIPKIQIGNDIYIWPYEIFLVLFIFTNLFVYNKNMIWLKSERGYLILLVIFLYFLVSTPLFALLRLDDLTISPSEILRNFKTILYLIIPILFFRHMKRFSIDQFYMKFIWMWGLYCLIILLIAINHILLHSMSISELIWTYGVNRPYPITERYLNLSTFTVELLGKGSHNAMANISTLATIIVLYFYSSKQLKAIPALFLISIFLFVVFLSFSRSGLFIYIISVILSLLYLFSYKTNVIIGLLKISLIMIPIGLVFLFIKPEFLEMTVLSKINFTIQDTGEFGVDGSLGVRIKILLTVIESFLVHPLSLIFGVGYGRDAVLWFTNNEFQITESLILGFIVWGGIPITLLFFKWYYYVYRLFKEIGNNHKMIGAITFYWLLFFLPNLLSGGDLLQDIHMMVFFPIISFAIALKTKKYEYSTNNPTR